MYKLNKKQLFCLNTKPYLNTDINYHKMSYIVFNKNGWIKFDVFIVLLMLN